MSKSARRKDSDRAGLEQMSTAALEELLLQDFHAPGHGESDMSRLYQAAQVLAEREQAPSAAADQAWKEFRERYLPFVELGGLRAEDGVPPSGPTGPRSAGSPATSQWRSWSG